MKKIRLGNDIHVSWEILRNGEPEDFTDKVVEVKLVHAQTFTAVPIEWSIEGNVIEFDFFGKDQKRKGEYRIILTENRGELGMSTLDACEAFYLVDHSCKESDGTKCPTLKVQHVRLTGSFSLSGGGGKGSFPNVDELPTIDSLTGEEKVILTLQGENYQTDMNKLKEWALQNNQFISYPTMADYDADKANLTEECYVAIDETEEVFLHKLKPAWNAYYELEEAYVNFVREQIGLMVGGAPLTLRADLFKSFVVNGEERITGDEVLNPEDPAATAIVVPFNIGDVYEVYFELKDLSEYVVSNQDELAHLFLYSPLTKITLDKSFASANDSAVSIPYIFAIYGTQGCPIMREITFNFEADPWKDNQEALRTLLRCFRSEGGLYGFFSVMTTGERIARIPNGDWGIEYSEGAGLSENVGLVTVFTKPDQDYNYTIERYDYGTI